MSTPAHVAIFKSLVTDDLPDVHRLEDRLQVFWVLAASKPEPAVQSLTPAQIADILQESCGIAMTRQRVMAILSQSAGFVAVSRRAGRKQFRIMKRGEDDLAGNAFEPIVIDPERPHSTTRPVKEIMQKLTGDIRICDPHVSSGTLDYVAQSSQVASIKLLTENVQDSSRMKRDLAALTKEHSAKLEIRVSQAGQIHDRYILHKDGMLLVGTSLKDLGKKQSLVVQLSTSFAAEMSRAFDREWNRATKLS